MSLRVSSESSAYFLIAHGSRDARSRQALEACTLLVRQELANHSDWANPWPQVGNGVLEFGDRPLSEQIHTFAEAADQDGIRKVYLLPLFLMMGNHVQEDLPEAVSKARSLMSSEVRQRVELVLCPALGTHPDIPQLLRERMAELPCDRWLLIAHGTRRSGGNAPIAALADHLGALPAYWSTEPSLETQLSTHLQNQPNPQAPDALRVGILPYFLFTGSLMDAMGEAVSELQIKFPTLQLEMMPPLNPSPLLAKLLLNLCL